MNRDHIYGMAKSFVGLLTEIAGKALGNRKTFAEGLALRLAGREQLALGNTRQVIRRLGR